MHVSGETAESSRYTSVPIMMVTGKYGAPAYHGKPCPLGHTIKYVKTGTCIPCNAAKDHRKAMKKARERARRNWISESIKRQEAF